MLLLFEIAWLTFLVLGTHGMITPLDQPVTTDFASFYAAGTLTNEGNPGLVYDQAAHLAAEERATEPGIKYQFFYYPPMLLMVCAALARLPYLPAFIAFEAATGLLCVLVTCRILKDNSRTALIVILAFPAVFWTIGLGQNAFLTAALFGAATLLIDDRPVLAGLLFGMLCYKPHLGLLVPVALAAGRRWRAFFAGAVSVLGLCGLSTVLFGVETWQSYLAVGAHAAETYKFGRIDFSGMISLFGAIRLAGGGLLTAYAAQIAAAVAATAAMAWLWWTDARLELRAASLAAATLLTVPVVLLYDLMLAGVAMAWLFRDSRGRADNAGQATCFAAIFLIALTMRDLGSTYHVPLGPLPALLLLGLTMRRAVSDRAMRAPCHATGAICL
jgi:hypothetical protein